MENINFLSSKIFRYSLGVIGALIILILVFKAGMMVGFRKADFSFRWGENYHRNFGGPRDGFMQPFRGRDLIDSNGTVGEVLKVEGSTIVVKGRDGVERIIIVKKDATMKRQRGDVKISDIKVGDFIIVIGEPNKQGQIEAKFLRQMPPPPASVQTTSTSSTVK